MKPGDYVNTPRFCTVKIERVYENRDAAASAGYNEPTYYENADYGIVGKSIDQYHMVFAAFTK